MKNRFVWELFVLGSSVKLNLVRSDKEMQWATCLPFITGFKRKTNKQKAFVLLGGNMLRFLDWESKPCGKSGNGHRRRRARESGRLHPRVHHRQPAAGHLHPLLYVHVSQCNCSWCKDISVHHADLKYVLSHLTTLYLQLYCTFYVHCKHLLYITQLFADLRDAGEKLNKLS